MKKLLRNKKALDYSAFMVIVVLIVVTYLAVQLYVKLDVFEMRMGDQELALMNSYAEEDKLLLFIDKSAEFSAYRAIENTAYYGGFISGKESAGTIGPIVDKGVYHTYPYWLRDKKKYYKAINFYDIFKYNLNDELNYYFKKYPAAIPSNNYDFTITSDKVLGIPTKPVLLPIFTETDKKELFYGSVINKVTSDLKLDYSLELGVYAVRPAFSVNVKTHLDGFAEIPDKVDIFLNCIVSDTVDACAKQASTADTEWFVTQVTNSNIYIFDVLLKNLINPYDSDKVYLRFALEL